MCEGEEERKMSCCEWVLGEDAITLSYAFAADHALLCDQFIEIFCYYSETQHLEVGS